MGRLQGKERETSSARPPDGARETKMPRAIIERTTVGVAAPDRAIQAFRLPSDPRARAIQGGSFGFLRPEAFARSRPRRPAIAGTGGPRDQDPPVPGNGRVRQG